MKHTDNEPSYLPVEALQVMTVFRFCSYAVAILFLVWLFIDHVEPSLQNLN